MVGGKPTHFYVAATTRPLMAPRSSGSYRDSVWRLASMPGRSRSSSNVTAAGCSGSLVAARRGDNESAVATLVEKTARLLVERGFMVPITHAGRETDHADTGGRPSSSDRAGSQLSGNRLALAFDDCRI